MSTDAKEQTQQAEQAEEQAEADFAKGFGAAPVEPAPAQETLTDKEDAKTEESAKPATEEPKKDDAPAEGPRIAGMTEAEFNAAVAKGVSPVVEEMRKEIRKNFGQIGDLNRIINELKTARASTPAAARKFTADMLKRVNEELPGLGAALAEDLSEILGGAEKAQDKAEAQGKPFDQQKYHEETVVPELHKLRRDMEVKLLKYAHPDYLTVVYADPAERKWTPEFAAWVAAQPADKQEIIANSDDATEVAAYITEYKAHAEKARKEAEKAKLEKERKDKRLEEAVMPEGSGAPPASQTNDEEADFEKGFKKASKGYAR